MKYRWFRGKQISEVGLGTWQLGNADWGAFDTDEALSILQTFAGSGGNFIDTADVYGMGISETIIGQFLKSTENEILVATKLGRRHDNPGGWETNLTYEAMRENVERSLQNLGLPSLFLEQLHCISTDELTAGKVFDHLRQLQLEKLIDNWGVSVETSEEALLCLKQDGLASLQIIFNLFRQHVADEIFALARENNIGIIVRVPLASGLLTGKFTNQTIFAQNDHRNFNAEGNAFNAGETFSGINFNQGLEFAKQMCHLLPDEKMAQWAIRWILDFPDVTTVIPGASKVLQVERNVAASDLPPLNADIHHKLKSIYEREIKPAIRGHY